MSEQRTRFILPFAIFCAIMAVSTASVFIRFAQRDAPSLVIAAYRLTLASIFIAPVALIHYRAELRNLTRTDVLLGLLSGIFLALHFATWISSLEYTTVASSVVLVSTSPLWVALLAPLILREALTRSVLVGMALALLGGMIIGMSDSCSFQERLACPTLSEFVKGEAFLGNVLALAGAFAVAGYLMIGRRLRKKMSLVPYIFIVYGMASLMLIAIMLGSGESPIGYPKITYLWMLLLAIIPQLIGHSTYNWSLRYLPAAFVAITTLGEPIGSITLAYYILQEVPSLIKIIGALLILFGIYTASQPGSFQSK